jgi:hypothetical protein
MLSPWQGAVTRVVPPLLILQPLLLKLKLTPFLVACLTENRFSVATGTCRTSVSRKRVLPVRSSTSPTAMGVPLLPLPKLTVMSSVMGRTFTRMLT